MNQRVNKHKKVKQEKWLSYEGFIPCDKRTVETIQHEWQHDPEAGHPGNITYHPRITGRPEGEIGWNSADR